MLYDLTFSCNLTTFSGKKCLSGKVICVFFLSRLSKFSCRVLVRLQELQKSARGIGDLETRRIMWQLVRAVDHLHSSQVPQCCQLSMTPPLLSCRSVGSSLDAIHPIRHTLL
jgi:hypothetical protein